MQDSRYKSAVAAQATRQAGSLRLILARRLPERLLGLHGLAALGPGQGLYLVPCRAIHTIGLKQPIDIVFVDERANLLKRIDRLPPRRWAICRGAHGVIELQAGFCDDHADHAAQIRCALRAGRFIPYGSWRRKH